MMEICGVVAIAIVMMMVACPEAFIMLALVAIMTPIAQMVVLLLAPEQKKESKNA